MRKIESIDAKNFLFSYLQAQEQQPVFDRAFFLGVVSTIVAPQLIFCFFFGSFFALVFGACALSSGGLGVRAYRRFSSPYEELKLGLGAQTPAKAKPRLKKAA